MDLLHGLLLLHQADVAPFLACQLVSQDLPAVYEFCCHAAPDMEKLCSSNALVPGLST